MILERGYYMNNNLIIILIISALLIIFEVICMWRVYKKLGLPGWNCIVPIYNIYVLFKLANIPMWMFILLFLPLVNFYPIYLINISIVDRLGMKRMYAILMLFIPFIIWPLFAFSKAKVESMYMNLDEVNIQPTIQPTVLKDGPIEPLGAMPDIEPVIPEEEIDIIDIPNTYNEIPQNMVTSNIAAPNFGEPYLEPIESIIPINVVDPLTAQQKVQHIEEEKEVYPDVDIFKTCPNCGTKVEPNVSACFLCGKRFEE